MPLARITEYYPTKTPDGRSSIECREATAPRDLASMILLWTYCCFAFAQVTLAVAAASIAGLHLRPHTKVCLLQSEDPAATKQKGDACRFVIVAFGLTLPIAAGVVALELLTHRLAFPGVRNLVPLLLWLLGTIIWGVQAAQLQHLVGSDVEQDDPAAVAWRDNTLGLSWANFGLFLAAALLKLLQPSLSSSIDSASIALGRACPDNCLPACDACCCLDVAKAKLPREVLRQGRVQVRFVSWNQETVGAAPAAAVQGMTRADV